MTDLIGLAQQTSENNTAPDLLHLASGAKTPAAGSQGNPIDDTEHAAGAATIAHASLETKQKYAIEDYAAAFKQPVTDFDVTKEGHIIRKIPGTDTYARAEPSVRGATGPIDAAQRAMDWVVGGAGPAIPAITSTAAAALAALVVTPETLGAGALPAAMAGGAYGASGGEYMRQKFANALRPDGAEERHMDYENMAWQAAAGAAGPVIGKGIELAAPVVGRAVTQLGKAGAAADMVSAGVGDAAEQAATRGAVGPLSKNAAANAIQQQIKNIAQSYYKKAEDAGVILSQESFQKFADELPGQLHGYHEIVNDQAAKLIKMLQSEAANGPMTLERLDALRSVASGISAGKDLNEARIAGNIVGKIDSYIDSIGAGDLVSSETTNAQAAIEALKNARSAWRTYSKLTTINDIVDTGEMLNDQNWVKGRFRALVKSQQFDRFTPEEQQAIASVAKTGNLEKAVKLLPWRGLQMASTYAEPFMQDAKVGSVRNLIARGADDVIAAVERGPASDEVVSGAFDGSVSTGPIISSSRKRLWSDSIKPLMESDNDEKSSLAAQMIDSVIHRDLSGKGRQFYAHDVDNNVLGAVDFNRGVGPGSYIVNFLGSLQKGVGTTLMNKVEDTVAKNGGGKIQVKAYEGSVEFYESRGYKIAPDQVIDHGEEVLMTKDIPAGTRPAENIPKSLPTRGKNDNLALTKAVTQAGVVGGTESLEGGSDK